MLCLLLVGLHCIARGQTEYAYRYWLDNASMTEHGGTSTDSIWTMELDVDSLGEGLHQLHVQVRDTAGLWSTPQSRFFLKATPVDATDLKVRYWFDDGLEITEMQGASGVHDIDVSALSWGLHSVNYQVAGSNGIYSPTSTAMFMKIRMGSEAYTARCYIGDSLYAEQKLPMEECVINWDLDVSDIPRGLHSVRMLVCTPEGYATSVAHSFFWRSMANEASTAQCYVNDSLYSEQAVEPEGGFVNWNLDVSSLPRGLHSLRMQVNTQDGTAVSVAHSFFWREQTAAEHNATRCVYTVDGGRTFHEAPAMNDNGYRFDVDISALEEGLHQLLCMIVDAENTVLHSCYKFFMVTKNTVMRYDYWVNDDTLNTRTVMAMQSIEPYSMLEMIDVESYPMRSSAFHFEVENAIPYVSALNELHVRFYSTNGTYVEDSCMYVDGTSKQEVTGLLPLLSGTPRTDATPAANSIRWYRLEAYADNELSFRVSQPCTVQLFSPEGAVLLDVCGTAVTDTFSCRSTTGGSYYVALHDVTGTEDETTIEYLHEGHVLTFMVDGEVYSCDTLAYGVLVAAPELPEREGYSCTGWSEVPATMPAHDVTVTGSYVLNSVQTDAQGLIYTLADGRDAFTVSGYTDSLVADVTIPAELYGLPVSAIAEDALADARGLASIVVPHSVERVGDDAFCGCTALLVVDWLSSAPLSARSFDRPSSYGNMLVFVSDASTEVTFDGNIVTEGTAREIVLIDGLPFRNPRDFTADYISYSRDFTKPTEPGVAGGWEALVVPFDVERITSSSKGALAPIGLADHTTTLPSWVAEWADSTASFLLVDAIRANEPFIMSVPNSDKYEDKYNVQGTISFSAENAVVRSTEKCGYAASEGFSFVGSYEGVSCDATVYALNDEEYTAVDGVVYMAGGVFAPALRDVRPFESYATHEGAHKAPYLRIGGRDDTGIVNVVISTTDDGWYTLQGIRLNGKPTDKGVYIHRGELIMVK